MSQENTPISSTTDDGLCRVCGLADNICDGLGMIRYDVPVGDERFGKLFRCPNNPAEQDLSWQRRLRQLSNLDMFADKTLDNYQIDLTMHSEAAQKSLWLALQSSQRFAENPDGWLLLEGTYGCGKTHLAAAIGNKRIRLGDSVIFVTVPDLLDHLRSSYGPSSEEGYDETFERIRNTDLLILDDLGVENPSPWAQEKLFQLLNSRYSTQKSTIITTNTDIDTLDPRIRSRLLDTNLILRVNIDAPDFRSLVQNETMQLNQMLYNEQTFETFDFVTDTDEDDYENLKRMLEVVKSYAQAPEGWLLLMGGYGTGKTHLAAAVASYKRDRNEQVMFISVPDLLDYLRTAFNPGVQMRFDQRFNAVRDTELLILDDLGAETTSTWAQEKLFQLLDYRYVRRLPTMLTTSKELGEINDRLEVRLLDKRICVRYAITAKPFALRNTTGKRSK